MNEYNLGSWMEGMDRVHLMMALDEIDCVHTGENEYLMNITSIAKLKGYTPTEVNDHLPTNANFWINENAW